MSQGTTQAGCTIPDLLRNLREARARTLDLVSDLDDEQLIGPRLGIVNPLRWEIGHVAYFQEFWCLRHFRGEQPILDEADQLYDSARIPHDTRWDLPLPSREDTLDFMQRVLDRVIESNLSSTDKQIDGYDQRYFLQLALFHEQMHAEAITYTRQTLGYSAPRFTAKTDTASRQKRHTTRLLGDAHIPGGRFSLGRSSTSGFIFDNEQSAHEIEVRPFSISRTAVTEADFAAFVEDDGYHRSELWSKAGWQWRQGEDAERPVYWRRESTGRWIRRHFDQWVPLEDRRAMIHVNWYEADAYCRWAGRRLPTEAEWEMAASCEPSTDGGISARKRVYPWGDAPPTPDRANLDWRAMGAIQVDELPAGDSGFGCRMMIGNCWEWTSTDFGPYPGFAPGPYKEYSEPWFVDHKVLRGGCWVTRSSMIHNAYRNFYPPNRRDVWAGFRTCAAQVS